MKTTESAHKPQICPLCGQSFTQRPSISRRDNTTEICPDCGTREALEDWGLSPEERESVIQVIHKHDSDTRNSR